MIRKRDRRVYFISILIVVIAGLGSRKYPDILPEFIAEYSGDTLWALMVFLISGFIFRTNSTSRNAVISVIFCFTIELSQLYTSAWIDGIRKTLLGGLILGYGFLWSDLICYIMGIAAGVLLERFILVKNKPI